jgi:hypothetical protein
MRGPIIVGGLGGSGTRVVARILQILGGHMGENLNSSLDNLWWTLLFKRPRFRERCDAYLADVDEVLSLFKTATLDGLWDMLSDREENILTAAFSEHLADVTISQVDSIRKSTGLNPSAYNFWGWKEPCVSFWLEELASFFQRYVVVQFEELCMYPEGTVAGLLDCLGLTATDEQMAEILGFVHVPESIGRGSRESIAAAQA